VAERRPTPGKELDAVRFAERVAPWLIPQGPDADVVISCRVRLARNVQGYPFVSKLSAERAVELCERLKPDLARLAVDGDMLWVKIADAPLVVRLLLRERHLVSRDLAPSGEERPALPGRAVAFSRGETLSVMVNEEDHLRIQSMASGFDLAQAFERAQACDRALEERVPFAYDSRYGYLTCCPTNVGTGLRASVMLHLPALGLVRSELEKVFAAAARTGLAIRGLYGEGSRAVGDFYQVSNQVTLGRAEGALVAELADLVPAIVRFERAVRKELVDTGKTAIVDRVNRSYGVLRSARAMPTDDALRHLSALRLGAALGIWSALPIQDLARIRVQIQKAHLQVLSQKQVSHELIDPTERDRLRAAFLRHALAARNGGSA
jgi:protein arginine kinase